MWPFNRASKQTPADSNSDYITPDEFLRSSVCAQLTPDEQWVIERRLEAFSGHKVHPQHAANMFGVFAAAALATYALDLAREAAEEVDSEDNPELAAEAVALEAEKPKMFEAAISALQRAYRIYPHPALKTHLAGVLDAVGRTFEANEMRSEASREEATRLRKETDGILVADLTYRL